MAAEPYNVTAVYNLGVALTRMGRRDEGLKTTTRFQELRESLYKTQMGTAYLDQGRYAEALATTGAEAGLVDRATPSVAFRDAAGAIPKVAAAKTAAGGLDPAKARLVDEVKKAGLASSLALADLDGDGRIDLLQVGAAGVVVLHNDGGRFTDTTAKSGLAAAKGLAAVAGDYDGDGKPDLLVLEPFQPRLFKNDGKGGFRGDDRGREDRGVALSRGECRVRGCGSRRRPGRPAGRFRGPHDRRFGTGSKPLAPEQRRRDLHRHHGDGQARHAARPRDRDRPHGLRRAARHRPARGPPRHGAVPLQERPGRLVQGRRGRGGPARHRLPRGGRGRRQQGQLQRLLLRRREGSRGVGSFRWPGPVRDAACARGDGGRPRGPDLRL